ncbi:MAG TPA: nitrogen assimilation transcriptional regulator NAC, partial [Acetobacteraceae bacterium]|nr:nitrogen assimilation transcriptional regulator NAC [Acetobacteraceae bacterium]
ADLLNIAQPALSQQIAILESEVKQRLLVRTKRGVSPTEAGKTLYRHAQAILRQCEQARMDMQTESRGVSGPVSVGLAPGTAAATLGLPLIRRIRSQHPGIVPYLNENYGTALSELVMSGRMDLAVLYGNRPVHGLSFTPLMQEELFLVGPSSGSDAIPLAELDGIGLFLPRPYNVVRKLVDENFMRARIQFRLIAEVESAMTLKALINEGLGATISPWSMAREIAGDRPSWCRHIVDPVIAAPLTLCQSDHLPLSEPAQVVRAILLELAGSLGAGATWPHDSGDPGAP